MALAPIPVVLRCCDCLSPFDGLTSLPRHSIDLAIVDPPYGVTANRWDQRIDLVPLFAGLEHALKERGTLVVFSQGRLTAELMTGPWAKHWRYNMVWAKNKSRNFFHCSKMPLRAHEDLVVFYRERGTYVPQMNTPRMMGRGGGNPRNRTEQGSNYYAPSANISPRYGATDRHPTTVLPFPVVNETDTVHPTEKPQALLEFLVRSFSNAGDTVLDPCMGVGSSGRAAVRCVRSFVGFELDPVYFDTALARIQLEHWAPGRVRLVCALPAR